MTVAYLLDRYPQRTQTFVRLEIDELRRQGTPVAVFALRPGDLGRDPAAVYLRDLPAGKLRYGTAHARAAATAPARYAAFVRTRRALRSERAEMMARRLPAIAEAVVASGATRLHAHFAWSAAAVTQAVAALTGLPWSLTVHGNDLFGDVRNLDAKLRAADRVVTVCAYNRRHLAERHGIGAGVVVCGVEVPEPWEPVAADVDIVAAGRLVEKKGFDLLLEAADPRWSIDVVGDGPERGTLEAIVARRGLTGVRFLGAQDHASTLERIARGRVLCLPARVARNGDRDSMPVVVKEAMARGVPTVATREVGIPEMVDDTTGWLVPPGDIAALRAALAEALADEPARARKGALARARAIARFTLAAEVGRLREEVLT